jgi:hypothetical protein|tara:strand:- start:380 stop:568 length:189 start_codon:yes stop_codon:yes gene_type:complete
MCARDDEIASGDIVTWTSRTRGASSRAAVAPNRSRLHPRDMRRLLPTEARASFALQAAVKQS